MKSIPCYETGQCLTKSFLTEIRNIKTLKLLYIYFARKQTNKQSHKDYIQRTKKDKAQRICKGQSMNIHELALSWHYLKSRSTLRPPMGCNTVMFISGFHQKCFGFCFTELCNEALHSGESLSVSDSSRKRNTGS